MAALLIGCGNCGDGSGWQVWRPNGGRGFVWVACADCNDDGKKPKPDLCEGCGETEPFCLCGTGNQAALTEIGSVPSEAK